MDRSEIRLALPSKGRLAEEAFKLLANSGLQVYKPNPRQYIASIPSLPGVTVLFQRAGDIAVSVRDGAVDFGREMPEFQTFSSMPLDDQPEAPRHGIPRPGGRAVILGHLLKPLEEVLEKLMIDSGPRVGYQELS